MWGINAVLTLTARGRGHSPDSWCVSNLQWVSCETTRTDSQWAPCFCSHTEDALIPSTTRQRVEYWRSFVQVRHYSATVTAQVCSLFVFVSVKWHWPSTILLLCIVCFCMFWNLLRIFIVNGNHVCVCVFLLSFFFEKNRRLRLRDNVELLMRKNALNKRQGFFFKSDVYWLTQSHFKAWQKQTTRKAMKWGDRTSTITWQTFTKHMHTLHETQQSAIYTLIPFSLKTAIPILREPTVLPWQPGPGSLASSCKMDMKLD